MLKSLPESDSVPQKIVAVIPAYNEERFIASVVFLARQQAHHVLVINDGSTDRTSLLAQEAGAEVISIPHGGKAAALTAGFRQAMNLDPSVIVTLDADAQHDPAEIPAVAGPIIEDQADVVVGSRFMNTHSIIPSWRKIGQHALTWMTNAASGVRITDSQSGYRAFSPRALSCLKLSSMGLGVESEMQMQWKHAQLRVIEVGISVQYKDKMKRNPFTHGIRVVDTILKAVAQHHPLLIFGLPGILSSGFGLTAGWVVINAMMERHVLLTGTAIAGTVFGIGGLLLMITAIILHSLESVVSRIKMDIDTLASSSSPEKSVTP